MELILVGIDRDGTINLDYGGFFGKDSDWKTKLKLHEGVAEGIKLLNQNKDIKIVIATNKSGIARRIFTIKRVEEINKTINNLLLSKGAIIHNWQYCPYIDNDYLTTRGLVKIKNKFILENNDPKIELRKPKIGMLKRASEEMGYKLNDFSKIYFIGDKIEDLQMGLNASGKGILVYQKLNESNEKAKKWLEDNKNKDLIIVDTFLDAAKFIIKDIKNI